MRACAWWHISVGQCPGAVSLKNQDHSQCMWLQPGCCCTVVNCLVGSKARRQQDLLHLVKMITVGVS
jgi:hypothetical protein